MYHLLKNNDCTTQTQATSTKRIAGVFAGIFSFAFIIAIGVSFSSISNSSNIAYAEEETMAKEETMLAEETMAKEETMATEETMAKEETMLAESEIPVPFLTRGDGERVASVNGVNINSSLVEALFQAAQQQAQFQAAQTGQQAPPVNRNDLLENLIVGEIILQKAVEANLLDTPEVQAQLINAYYNILGRSFITDYLSKNPAPDDFINERYEELKTNYEGKNEYLTYHILVKEEDKVKQLMADIDGNPDKLKSLAAEHSIDTGSGANQGALGWSPSEAYVPEFKQAVETIEPGTVSKEAIKTQFGWHIIYVADSRELEIPPLDERLRASISGSYEERAVQELLQQLRSGAKVELAAQ